MLEDNVSIQKETIIQSKDVIFGSTNFNYGKTDLYKSVSKQVYNTKNKKGVLDSSTSLYAVILNQAETSLVVQIVPDNFVDIVSISGGFITCLTVLIAWALASYQQFQYRKASIKKLYFYSRTKKKQSEEEQTRFSSLKGLGGSIIKNGPLSVLAPKRKETDTPTKKFGQFQQTMDPKKDRSISLDGDKTLEFSDGSDLDFTNTQLDDKSS